MSVGLVKVFMYGKNFSLYAPADVFFIYEEWKTHIPADAFNPLIPIVGGMSFVTGHDRDNRALEAVLFGEDWLNKCREAGVGTKNALICLASNFDDQMGMAALSLELAMIANKPKTHAKVRIDFETYIEIVEEIFAKDYAGVRLMAEKWGVVIKEGFEFEPKKTRSDWREKLGHDVLIHPATLQPCKDDDGSVLEYAGVAHDEATGKCSFKFIRRATGEEVLSPTFLPASIS